MLEVDISYFMNATDTEPHTCSLNAWLTGNFPKLKFLVDKIRATQDKFQRDQLKKQLPAITPSGTFTKRNKQSLITHSRLIAFDIDNVGDSIGDVKHALMQIPNIAYCALSVSGSGLWGLIPISHPEKHEAHFRAIELSFLAIGIVIDPSCKDVSRLRFYSYDPEAYFNYSAEVFTETFYDPPPPTVTFSGSSIHVVDRACKMVLNAPDGQKHFVLNKAAFLLGGYVAAGKIYENEARNALRSAICSREIESSESAFRTIDKGLKDGQLKPVH